MKKTVFGEYVTATDEHGYQVDTGVFADMSVRGAFRTRYSAHVDRVIVEVAPARSSGPASMRMQLTPEQAAGLRDLIDAALSDYVAAHVVSPLAIEAVGE